MIQYLPYQVLQALRQFIIEKIKVLPSILVLTTLITLVTSGVYLQLAPPKAYAASIQMLLQNDTGQQTGDFAFQIGDSWKIYQDMRYDFSLAIPSKWYVSPAPIEGTFATTSITNYDPSKVHDSQEPYSQAVKIDFVVLPLYEGQTLEKWVDDFIDKQTQSENSQAEGRFVEDRESSIVDGREVVKIQIGRV